MKQKTNKYLTGKCDIKGGTTEIALETLDKYEFAKGVLKAVLNAKERSINLGSELNSEIQENAQK